MIEPHALSQAGFAPFGRVIEAPALPRRDYFDAELASHRSHASASLSLVTNDPVRERTLAFSSLECHPHSSQSFVPMNAGRWLVVVAPEALGRPDMPRALAFIAGPSQGITLHPGVWHLGLHVLDRRSTHAIFMWRDQTEGDETFVDVEPTTIDLSKILKEA
ncbi:ureidoglycolate lyase [Variovorax sp.]|jgi:ureidoglycolate lyase|uniref:ureidoglycolate lyase n=1 Tax=Variovorax sp. TaxID=1871043 RepID=UPI003BA865CA